jgi:hypothetical protein
VKIHISKTSIAFLDESDILLEECNNNLSSSRILVQNIENAEAFFTELIKKHCQSIIRPKITLVVDDTIFEDKITQVEERAIFDVLYRAGARKLIYKGKNIRHNI